MGLKAHLYLLMQLIIEMLLVRPTTKDKQTKSVNNALAKVTNRSALKKQSEKTDSESEISKAANELLANKGINFIMQKLLTLGWSNILKPKKTAYVCYHQ